MRRILVEVVKGHIKDQEEFKAKEISSRGSWQGAERRIFAVVALARKVLCILLYLLMNHENFKSQRSRNQTKIPSSVSSISMMDIDEMIKVISQAGYLWRKI